MMAKKDSKQTNKKATTIKQEYIIEDNIILNLATERKKI